jgi:flagellar biosynthesis protein FlhF
MQYFTEQAPTHAEVLEKIKIRYGERAKTLTHRTIRVGGFLGLFTREGVEVTGYLSNEYVNRPKIDLEQEKKKILGNVKNGQTLDLLFKEVQQIKDKIGESMDHQIGELHPTIEQVEDVLQRNDFDRSYIKMISDKIRSQFSLDELEDYAKVQDQVVEWIGDSIEIFTHRLELKPDIFVLVGPTGVGKTTTIAKLAAMFGIAGKSNPLEVRIITIDNYRIGAKNQIETYGDIMGIPVSCAETFQDLQKYIALYQDVDMIFVDTVGKSPKDYAKLGEMKQLLEACGRSTSFHLAISATTKTADIHEILRQFEPFGYKSIVLTKLDETTGIGNLISVVSQKQKPIAFITDGQRVPQDIERATKLKLLLNLDGFRINRDRLEAKLTEV